MSIIFFINFDLLGVVTYVNSVTLNSQCISFFYNIFLYSIV